MTINELKERYDLICNTCIERFCRKQDFTFSHWSGEVGGVACFNNFYCFNLSDIILDLTTNQPKHQILKWADRYRKLDPIGQKKPDSSYENYIKNVSF